MPATYPIAPNGIFWTLQGEGALMGTPMAFVRLAGCSVGCAECDTDYRVDRRLTVDEIVAGVRSVIPAAFRWSWVWITGGEPTDHDLASLVAALRGAGYRLALATAGVREVPAGLVDWISVSPHRISQTVQRFGAEVKLVPGLNGVTFGDADEIDRWSFAWKFIQPIAGGSTGAAASFVLSRPGWSLTLQAHKGWNLP